jgi:hypothetical protein
MKAITPNGFIDGVALIFEVTDEQLAELSKNNAAITSPSKLAEYYASDGDNAHIFFVYQEREDNLIPSKIDELLRFYKSVSWWDKDINEFKIIRR